MGHGGKKAHPFAGLPVREHAFIIAEGIQEGTYDSVNASSGALGRWQVLPSNVAAWTKEALGHSLTPDEFLHSHAAQDAVARTKLGGYYEQYGLRGAAAAWYSGSASNKNNTASQGAYPSIYAYTETVKARTATIAKSLKSQGTGHVPKPIVAPLHQANDAAKATARRLYANGLRGHDLVVSFAFLWDETKGTFSESSVSHYIGQYRKDREAALSQAESTPGWRAYVGKSLAALAEVGHPTSYDPTSPEDIINGAGGVAGHLVQKTADAVPDPVANFLADFDTFLTQFANPEFWLRIGLILIGAIVLIIALGKLAGVQTVPSEG